MQEFVKIGFDIEVITPMFLSGANQSKAVSRVRAASIKGLLRYWWRALRAESNLDKLRKEENVIFGSSVENIGRSSFSLRIPHHPSARSKETFPVNILKYLAYGPCYKNVIVREYIEPRSKFGIHMNIFKDTYLNEILKSMYVFSLFGGIGSRSRNGFGSFDILNKEDVFTPIADKFSITEPYTKTNLQKLIKNIEDQSYSAFSGDTKIFKTKDAYKTWDETLAEVGKIYRQVRLSLEGKHTYEKRQYIGAPLFHSFLERHSKPYFIKIAKEHGKYRAYILYLPSRYCVGLEKDRNNRPIDHMRVDIEFKQVCGEFNQFLSKKMETII